MIILTIDPDLDLELIKGGWGIWVFVLPVAFGYFRDFNLDDFQSGMVVLRIGKYYFLLLVILCDWSIICNWQFWWITISFIGIIFNWVMTRKLKKTPDILKHTENLKGDRFLRSSERISATANESERCALSLFSVKSHMRWSPHLAMWSPILTPEIMRLVSTKPFLFSL